jgi:hypothetical protein
MEVRDIILRIVLHHLDLFQDDLFFTFDFVRRELRVEEKVGEEVDRPGEVFLQDLYVECGGLTGGESVEFSSHRIAFMGDHPGRAPLGALEEHVLSEVGDPPFMFLFIPGAGPDPDAHRDRLDRRNPLHHDAGSVVEVLLEVHQFWKFL